MRASSGLWDAIVDKLDPAGSRLVGPSWPDQPVASEPGMFDFVVPADRFGGAVTADR